MIKKPSILALIPARAGSQRLPNKNMCMLNGKPMVQWTIESALEASISDHFTMDIAITTDCQQVIGLADSLGVPVDFTRPESLCHHDASSIDAAIHAIEYYSAIGRSYDWLLLLQPTSPLRQAKHIVEASMLISDQSNSIVSVSKPKACEAWALTLVNNSVSIIEKSTNTHAYLNGAMYFSRIQFMLKNRCFIDQETNQHYIMNLANSVDVDTQLEFYIAQRLMIKGSL